MLTALILLATPTEYMLRHYLVFHSPLVVWTPDPSGRARKGLGNNLARKCLERWNAAVGVDEGKNAF